VFLHWLLLLLALFLLSRPLSRPRRQESTSWQRISRLIWPSRCCVVHACPAICLLFSLWRFLVFMFICVWKCQYDPRTEHALSHNFAPAHKNICAHTQSGVRTQGGWGALQAREEVKTGKSKMNSRVLMQLQLIQVCGLSTIQRRPSLNSYVPLVS